MNDQLSYCPVVALVGRPNVGKSTLFNRLTQSRDALVADRPGVTRDRIYGNGKWGDRPYIVIDTGGISGEFEGVASLMASQAKQAIQEADILFFIVDAREGLHPEDQSLADYLRVTGKTVLLVINKIDGLDPEVASLDFYTLGLGDPIAIAASQNRGIHNLIERGFASLPEQDNFTDHTEVPTGIRVAIIGRPNVGKSTLVNRMLGEERVIVYDMPGTTRDSVFIPMEREGKQYTLIDTAGVRRRSKVYEALEKFSVVKSLKAIEECDVVIFLVDAHEHVTEQDLSLLGFVLDEGKALVLAVNKWDNLSLHQRDLVKLSLQRRLNFIDFARIHFISALHGTGVGHLFKYIQEAYKAATRDIATAKLNKILQQAIQEHAPPLVHGRRIKLRYAHLGGHRPPLIVIHGNQTAAVSTSYQRYLMNYFHKSLNMIGTPIRIEFKTGENPFAGRKNVLSDRQQRKRKRLLKFVKKG